MQNKLNLILKKIYGPGDKYLKALDSTDTCYLFYSYNKPAVYYNNDLIPLDLNPSHEYTLDEILKELPSPNPKHVVFYNKMILSSPDRIYNSIKIGPTQKSQSSLYENAVKVSTNSSQMDYEIPVPVHVPVHSTKTKRRSSKAASSHSSSRSNQNKEAGYITIASNNSSVLEEAVYESYTRGTVTKTGSQKSTNTGYSSTTGSRPGSRKRYIRRTSTKKKVVIV